MYDLHNGRLGLLRDLIRFFTRTGTRSPLPQPGRLGIRGRRRQLLLETFDLLLCGRQGVLF